MYRNSTAAGAAGEALGVVDASRFTGVATTADMKLLLHRRSIVVQDRADAATPGEQRIVAEAEQVEVERLVGLLLAVPLHFDGDGLRRLAGGEGQPAGPGDVVVVAGSGRVVRGLVDRKSGVM